MFSRTTTRAIDVGVVATRPMAMNTHSLIPGFGNPRLVGIPTHDQGRVRPPPAHPVGPLLVFFPLHVLDPDRTQDSSPDQGQRRVHHARRYRPSWLREGVVGDFGGDPLIVLVSPAFKSELSNHGTMTLRLVAKSCPVTTWQIASAILCRRPPRAQFHWHSRRSASRPRVDR